MFHDRPNVHVLNRLVDIHDQVRKHEMARFRKEKESMFRSELQARRIAIFREMSGMAHVFDQFTASAGWESDFAVKLWEHVREGRQLDLAIRSQIEFAREQLEYGERGYCGQIGMRIRVNATIVGIYATIVKGDSRFDYHLRDDIGRNILLRGLFERLVWRPSGSAYPLEAVDGSRVIVDGRVRHHLMQLGQPITTLDRIKVVGVSDDRE